MAEKEILIKAINRKDTATGPMMSMMDGESVWYSVFKSSVKDDTWDQLKEIKEGDRADIIWVSTISKRDGKTYNNLTGFSKVLRPEEEVKPVWVRRGGEAMSEPMTTPKSLPGETPPPKIIVPETGARQTCLNCAAEIVSLWDKKDENHADLVVAVAKRLYDALKEVW